MSVTERPRAQTLGTNRFCAFSAYSCMQALQWRSSAVKGDAMSKDAQPIPHAPGGHAGIAGTTAGSAVSRPARRVYPSRGNEAWRSTRRLEERGRSQHGAGERASILQPSVTVVIPTLNEAQNLREILPTLGLEYQIII